MSVVNEQVTRSVGRPKADIDWNQVSSWLEAHCTTASIAHRLGVDKNTLYNRCLSDNNCDFSTFSQLKRQKGDDDIRNKQHELALDGDKVMLVWLGKNRLGQTDKRETTTIKIEDVEAKIEVFVERLRNKEGYPADQIPEAAERYRAKLLDETGKAAS